MAEELKTSNMSNTPFKMRSGNSPLYKELGGTTIFGKDAKQFIKDYSGYSTIEKGIDWIKDRRSRRGKGKGSGASSAGSKTTPPKVNVRKDHKGNPLWHPPMAPKKNLRKPGLKQHLKKKGRSIEKYIFEKITDDKGNVIK